ncbi:hypothetical protein [Desulfobacterium sp. N47]|uniref:Uncharacterized protein n=1 Tax=uncultured Desulfobacterium sp. TaxID=201089 RepID=E1YLY1_9BACT|nr:unknown protein [uncultured Desulfobacterium sp.]
MINITLRNNINKYIFAWSEDIYPEKRSALKEQTIAKKHPVDRQA